VARLSAVSLSSTSAKQLGGAASSLLFSIFAMTCRGAVTDTLRQVAAAVAALDQGTGDPAVARDVMGLLSQIFRKAAR